MRSLLAGLRFLILPTNIPIPPPVGQSAIFLNPGPPPSIKFYTGDADERTPGEISAGSPGGNPQLFIVGPDTNSSTFGPYNENMGISAGSPNTESFYESFSEDWAWYTNSGAHLLLGLQGINGFNAPTLDQVTLARFKSHDSSMQAKEDHDTAAHNGLTNTAYASQGPAGFTFKAPPSGRGLLSIKTHMQLTTVANVQRTVLSTPWLGTGTTIDAGTAVAIEGTTPASDSLRSIHLENPQAVVVSAWGMSGSDVYLIAGLTFGDDYNASIRHRISSATSASYDVLHQRVRWVPLY